MKMYATPLAYRLMLESCRNDGDISDNALQWGDRDNAKMFRADYRRRVGELVDRGIPRGEACRIMRKAMWYAAWYAQLATSHVDFVSWTTHPTHIPERSA